MFKMKNKIPVCFGLDNNYAQHAGVAIFSLLKNTNPKNIIIYILETDLSKDNKKKLIEMVRNLGGKIKFIHSKDSCFKDLSSFSYISKATYQRLLLPDILKKEEKVIYLDCDIVVEGDISELYFTDLEDKLISAVPDSIESKNKRTKVLGIPLKYDFFNAGVMLINCKKWRDLKVQEKTIDYLKKNKKLIVGAEQDALNALFYNDWKRLPLEWNVYFDSIERAKKENLSKEEIEKIKKNPKIIHYVSSSKPWHYSDVHPLKKRYWYYLKQTPWKEYKYPDKNIKNFFYKIYRYIATYSPKKIKNFKKFLDRYLSKAHNKIY